MLSLNRIALVIMFAIAGFMIWQFREKLYADKGQLIIVAPQSDNEPVVFSWHGEIQLPMAKQLGEAFDKWKSRSSHILIDLDSPGGSLFEGKQVVELIILMKRTHRVDTIVRAGKICLSMCVPIFLQGQMRMAAASSKWMFHQPSYVDDITDKKVKVSKSKQQALARKFFNRYLLDSEIDRKWLQNLQREWQKGDVWRTGQELYDEGANVINQLL